MSTLTKVLIVLQVFGVMALCVLVVSYVATADNYRQLYQQQQNRAISADQQRQATISEFEQYKATKEEQIANLNREITRRSTQVSALENQLASAQRQNAQLTDKVTTLTAQMELANNLASQQTELAKKAQDELSQIRAELEQTRARLAQVNDSLTEKLAVIDIQTKQIRSLAEEKAALQEKLEQTIRQFGKSVVPPVAPQPVAKTPTSPLPKDLNIRGTVTRVDHDNRLVEVSVGSAAGVREQMRLIVARGDRFICNLQVLAVEPDRAVGIIEMAQQPPQVGDEVTLGI
ncbi:MAG: hypothetical protein QHH07_05155 [Sedimentisphaerales bacterium]|nr:hypothetical protein [Sedimentisphaerales bacterium]